MIDGSHAGLTGHGFGLQYDQRKRWQSFLAQGQPNLFEVDLKLRKVQGSTRSDVTVELYPLVSGKPGTTALASATISSALLNTQTFTVVAAPLRYTGLVSGTRYALVLGQVVPDLACYEWCVKPNDPQESFGKLQGGWVDESALGDGWFKAWTTNQ